MSEEKILSALARLEEIATQSRQEIKSIGDVIVGIKISAAKSEEKIEGLKENIRGLGDSVRSHRENRDLHSRTVSSSFSGEQIGLWTTIIAFLIEHIHSIGILLNMVLTGFLIFMGMKK